MKKLFLLFCVSFFFISCSSSNQSIPEISGTWQCVEGCAGLCDFANTLIITQDNSSFIGHNPDPADVGSDFLGEINAEGQITATVDGGTCSGQKAGDKVLVECQTPQVDCQKATYQKQ